MNEKPLILYHGSCPDGFGAAYAAWKKYGDNAEYVPLHRGEPVPDVIDGREVYLIDFTYTRDVMEDILKRAGSLMVMDHHQGVEEETAIAPNHIYDARRSGATIAWGYFHPDTPVPYLLTLVEDQDNYTLTIPDTVPVTAYLEIHPYDFEEWDRIAKELEDPEKREKLLEKARTYAEYFEHLVQMATNKAKLVRFEGYEIYFGTSHPFKSLKSHVGHRLVEKKGPIALVVSAHPKGYGVSIRGDGTVDVAKIAAKYGGNGHTNSAGFPIPREGPFPWELIEHEDSGN
jgi:uncharacterized protein